MIQTEKEEASFSRKFEKKLNIIENLTRIPYSNKYEVKSPNEKTKSDKLYIKLSKLSSHKKPDFFNLINQKSNKKKSNKEPSILKGELIEQGSPVLSTSSRFIVTSLGEEIVEEENQTKNPRDCYNRKYNEISHKKEIMYLEKNRIESPKILVKNEKIDSLNLIEEYSINNNFGNDMPHKRKNLKFERKSIVKKERFTFQHLIESNDKFVEALRMVADPKN